MATNDAGLTIMRNCGTIGKVARFLGSGSDLVLPSGEDPEDKLCPHLKLIDIIGLGISYSRSAVAAATSERACGVRGLIMRANIVSTDPVLETARIQLVTHRLFGRSLWDCWSDEYLKHTDNGMGLKYELAMHLGLATFW